MCTCLPPRAAAWWRAARLGEEHRRAQVGAVDLVEGLGRDLGDSLLAVLADAVGEDVEPSQERRGLVDGSRDALDALAVHLDAVRAVSRGTQALRERFRLRLAAPGDHDRRAGFTERQRHRFTDAAVATGNEGLLSLEVNMISLWRTTDGKNELGGVGGSKAMGVWTAMSSAPCTTRRVVLAVLPPTPPTRSSRL
jgi:hypothetical protein